jgi:hypothetical protein
MRLNTPRFTQIHFLSTAHALEIRGCYYGETSEALNHVNVHDMHAQVHVHVDVRALASGLSEHNVHAHVRRA